MLRVDSVFAKTINFGTAGDNLLLNGNVGIGTTAPSYRFTVQNDDGVGNGLHFISGFQRLAGSDAQILVGYEANGSAVTAPYFYSANSQPLAFYTGGVNRLHITSTGNVGIGITAPQAKLHVGDGPIDAPYSDISPIAILAKSVAGTAYPLTISNSGTQVAGYKALMTFSFGSNWSATGYLGAAIENANANTGMVLGTYNTGDGLQERMRITSAGNVGIGTTNPSFKFEVDRTPTGIEQPIVGFQGNGTYDGIVGILQTAATGDPVLAFHSGSYVAHIGVDKSDDHKLEFTTGAPNWNNIGNATYVRMTMDRSGNVGIGTMAPLDKLSIGNSGAAPAGSASTGHNYTSTYLGTDNYALVNYGLVNTLVNSTNLWSGTKDANIWNGTAGAGKVGIGTTNPATQLHLFKGGAFTATGIFGQNAAQSNIIIQGGEPQLVFSGDMTSAGTQSGTEVMSAGLGFNYIGSNDFTAFRIGTDSAHDVQFRTSNAVRMTILSGGNVGIGITNPAYKFVVNGNTADWLSVSNNLANGSEFDFAHGGGYGAYIYAGSNSSASTYAFYVGGSGGNYFYVRGDGNVGIGATPTNKLQIGSVGASGYGGNDFVIGNGTQVMAIDANISGSTTFYTNTNYNFSNSGGGSTGNVGIGRSPGVKLDIYGGSSNSIETLLRLKNDNASNGSGSAILMGSYYADLYGSRISAKGYAGATVAHDLWLQSRNGSGDLNTGIYIDYSGNVGIGTTGPLAKLHVGTSPITAGDISTTGLFGSSVAGTAYPLSLANTDTQTVGDKALMSFAFGNNWSATAYVGAVIENVSAGTGLALGTYDDQVGMGERIRIDHHGNVGIGTTAPSYALDVQSATSDRVRFKTSLGEIHLSSYADGGEAYAGADSFYVPSRNLNIMTGLNGGEIRFNAVNGGAWTRSLTIASNGNAVFLGSVTATAFIYSSDRNLKQNIATIQSPLEKITQLRGVTFNWKKDNKPSMGLIAQEVEQVFPELVTGQEGSKAVQYGNLVAPLIEAVKEQQTEIKNNNEEIAKLKAQQAETVQLNANLLNRLKALEAKSKKR